MASKRKRVNPVKAFRLALSDASNVGGDDESGLLAGLVFVLWWTIAGVPIQRLEGEDSK